MPQNRFISQPPYGQQQGAALLLFFLAVLITGTLLIAGKVALDRGSVAFEDNTSQALAKAKQALIAYAISYYERGDVGRYGFLPCVEGPGSTSEGSESFNCETVSRYENQLGRLPWKTLRIETLKDGSGECLWYAVSGEYLNAGSAMSLMHNEDSPGMLRLWDENQVLIQGNTPEDRVVAMVIAPGPQLAGQNRMPASAASPCKVARNMVNPADYLDTLGAFDNSDVSGVADVVDDFVTAINLQGSTINDRIITITAQEIFDAIKSQPIFAARMDNLTEGLARCIAAYGIANVQTGGGGTCQTCAACYAANGCVSCQGLTGQARGVCNRCQRDCDRGGCQASCPGGGGGSNIYRLPWPAPVDLLADYRVSANYTDITAADVAGLGLLGRYPYDVTDSNTEVGTQLGTPVTGWDPILANCTTIQVAGGTITINFNDTTNEYRRLYEHWKDHFFYVVAADYAPNTTDNTLCTSCPSALDAAGNPYPNSPFAAIVFYADEIIPAQNQLRRTDETEQPPLPAPAVADTKAQIDNYLEGSNSSNYGPGASGGTYNAAMPPGANDRYCLIDNDATLTVTCP